MAMDTAVMGVDTDAADAAAAAAAEAAFAASLTSDMLASSFAAGDDMLAMDQGWMVDDSQPLVGTRSLTASRHRWWCNVESLA